MDALNHILQAARVVHHGGSGAALEGALGGTAKVEVNQLHPGCHGGARGLEQGIAFPAHQLQAHGNRALGAQVLQDGAARACLMGDAQKLRKSPSQVLGFVEL